jgi:hypothetical protein
MKTKRSIGITIFGSLLFLSAGAILVNTGRLLVFDTASLVEAIIYCAEAAFLAMLALGIMRLKNWARVVSLWIAWIAGFSIIFLGMTFGIALSTDPNSDVVTQLMLFALCFCAPVIILLTRSGVKKQFGKQKNEEPAPSEETAAADKAHDSEAQEQVDAPRP